MKVNYLWLKDLLPGCSLGGPESVSRTLTSIGHAVDTLTIRGEDAVFDLDITSNRPDCLSVIGIARELAAVHGASINMPPSDVIEEGPRIEGVTTVIVDSDDLCPRFCARVMTGVVVGESPDWLRARLETIGQRSINNVVDVTNYVLFETGHPVHAYDLDRLNGHMLRVRPARPGERLRTLDGVDRVLDPQVLVIADQKDAVGLAGIMGGEATEVSAGTKRILLESAAFEPRGIRRASKKLGLRTEASTRLEKGCDQEAALFAAARVCRLLQEMGCQVSRGYLDVRAASEPHGCIDLTAEEVATLVGVAIPIDECGKILEKLGFLVRFDAPSKLCACAPSYRNDVVSSVDLVEEIARIYGYDRIPSLLPPLDSEPEPLVPHLQLEEDLRDGLVGMGLTEVINYTFITPTGDPSQMRPLLNPISERTHLRNTLLPGLTESALHNFNNGNEGIRLFEIGHIFHLPDQECAALGILIPAGLPGESSWRSRGSTSDYYDLKGHIEDLFDRIGIRQVKFSPAPDGCTTMVVALLTAGGDEIGRCERIDIDSKHPAYAAELNLEALLTKVESRVSYRPLVRFPASSRDVSFLIDENIEYARLAAVVSEASGPEFTGLSLIDLYRGDKIPAGKKSMTMRLRYQSSEKTLTSVEVDSLHERCVRALEQAGDIRR